MRHILIPTDFSTSSLQLVEQAVQTLEGQKLEVTLFHAFEIPFFVQDLVGSTRKQPYHQLVTDEFRQACKQLKDQYPRTLHRIQFRFMHGDTIAVFRNFIDANDIDLIVCPEYYQYTKVHERSVNPIAFFQKSGIPVLKDLQLKRKEVVFMVQQDQQAQPQQEKTPAMAFARN